MKKMFKDITSLKWWKRKRRTNGRGTKEKNTRAKNADGQNRNTKAKDQQTNQPQWKLQVLKQAPSTNLTDEYDNMNQGKAGGRKTIGEGKD